MYRSTAVDVLQVSVMRRDDVSHQPLRGTSTDDEYDYFILELDALPDAVQGDAIPTDGRLQKQQPYAMGISVPIDATKRLILEACCSRFQSGNGTRQLHQTSIL